MALDYSKLSDEELRAIESGDYSRLSDATLQQLSAETQPVAPQPAQPYTSPAEADRNELLGLGALGAGAAATGAAAYKLAPVVGPKVLDVAKRFSPGAKIASTAFDIAKNVMSAAPSVTPSPATSPILDAQGRPMVRGPVAPTPAAPQPAQPGVIDKATQMVRQLAASKVMQGMARVGGTAAAALTPGNVGQNYPFPQSGPLRGSEINPATGRPWTPQELTAYRAQYGE
jgi:hypothetical protein